MDKSRVGIITTVVIISFIALFIVWNRPHREIISEPKPAPQQELECDPALWKHVYNPERLKIIDPCKTVTGVIEVIRPEQDGDYHILLRLDPEFSNLINDENVRQRGDLVIEPICQIPVVQADAIYACSNYQGRLVIPKVGTHVRVSGSYVLDLEHGSWAEIHPISKIGPIP